MTQALPRLLAGLALACTTLTVQAQVVENQQITSVPSIYRFGIDTRWTYAYVNTASPCTRQTFNGVDPAYGVVKRCEPVPINAASCVLPVMGGSGINPDFGFGAAGGWLSWWCASTRGPQLRIIAGPTMASLAGMKCFVTSAESPSKSLAKCAPVRVTDPSVRAVWEPVIGDILASMPK